MQAPLFITGGSSSSNSYYLFWKIRFVIAAAYYTRKPVILNWFAYLGKGRNWLKGKRVRGIWLLIFLCHTFCIETQIMRLADIYATGSKCLDEWGS